MDKMLNLALALIIMTSVQLQAQTTRYLTPIFDDVTVEVDIAYATNISILSSPPQRETLMLDLYTPADDTETSRPLVILFHTGNFLPRPFNGLVSGTRKDFPVVECARRLAQLGYVAAVVDYRLGWNPISSGINQRTGTLVNAVYRGIQDARSCVRFFRADAIDANNQYGICPERVICWGIGTGGYIATGANTLDSYEQLLTPKFLHSETDEPFVVESIHGDPFGTAVGLNPATGDTLSLPNTPGYDYKIQMAVSMGGATIDTSWIDSSDGAFLGFHVPEDPFIPYMEDYLVIPTSGELILEVQGSYTILQKANRLGLNANFNPSNDPFTLAANRYNDGLEGLYPLPRPASPNPFDTTSFEYEAAPWDWWDTDFWAMQPHPNCPVSFPLSECNFDIIARINNPDASEEKGNGYLDSIFGYFAPRAYAHLNLVADYCAPLSSKENLTAMDVDLRVMPNPSAGDVIFSSAVDRPMEVVEIFQLSGQRLSSDIVENHQFTWRRGSWAGGLYIARIKFSDGVVTQRLVLE